MSFIQSLKNVLKEEWNQSTTENGATGYRTTGKELLDMNFSVTSMRAREEEKITEQFIKVFFEDKMLAVKWLFYASDVREGMGERRLFRICFSYLANFHEEIARAVMELVPIYNRWDNLLCLLDTKLADDVAELMKCQLEEDMKHMQENQPVSLLGKWLPSANASSKETKRLAHILVEKFGLTERQYRKMLSRLRAYLKVVEVYMSRGDWGNIDYAAVPSKANMIYRQAFLVHDKERRKAYLESLCRGETKINAKVAFPHEIVHRYFENTSRWCRTLKSSDDVTLEEMWKALPDYVNGKGNTLCVADGSGSMMVNIGNSNVSCLDVANALAIYFSERNRGELKDNYITFSEHPQFVSFKHANSLREKLVIADQYNECANTNIEAVFELVLQTAVRYHMKQDEMPKNILILSDMEFDSCAICGMNGESKPNQKLFQVIANRYKANGYQLPRLVFWNINSRTGTIPVIENELGVALVSGFSPAIVKMVLSGKADPLECLLEQINGERYDAVEKALERVAV